MKKVQCGGRYNEELAQRVKCFFKIDVEKAGRKPWRHQAMTEEEKEAVEAAKVGVDLSSSKVGGAVDCILLVCPASQDTIPSSPNSQHEAIIA